MKTVVIFASLWLAAAQTVSYSNCCRGSLCSEKQDCPPCGSESQDGRACCDQDADSAEDSKAGSEAPCVHVEPSTDVLSGYEILKIEGPSTATLDALSVTSSPADTWVSLEFAPGTDPPSQRPETHAPLYLLDRVLRI